MIPKEVLVISKETSVTYKTVIVRKREKVLYNLFTKDITNTLLGGASPHCVIRLPDLIYSYLISIPPLQPHFIFPMHT